MDALLLSRLQFAAATFFHFLFVPLTLGLSILIAIMETVYVNTGDETYLRAAKFWGRIFLINFAVGVVTGITLEFQFGANWSRYSRYVGDIFGSLLAIEATLAFFLESTFLAVWAFGWKRLSPKAHAACIWLVALAANLSALWILIANAWMQHPVGYVNKNGKAQLTDFWAVIAQGFVCTTLFGVVGLYPNLIPSSFDPAFSMTVTNSSSSPLTLKIMLGVALTFVPIVIAYQVWVHFLFKEKLTDDEVAYEEGY